MSITKSNGVVIVITASLFSPQPHTPLTPVSSGPSPSEWDWQYGSPPASPPCMPAASSCYKERDKLYSHYWKDVIVALVAHLWCVPNIISSLAWGYNLMCWSTARDTKLLINNLKATHYGVKGTSCFHSPILPLPISPSSFPSSSLPLILLSLPPLSSPLQTFLH